MADPAGPRAAPSGPLTGRKRSFLPAFANERNRELDAEIRVRPGCRRPGGDSARPPARHPPAAPAPAGAGGAAGGGAHSGGGECGAHQGAHRAPGQRAAGDCVHAEPGEAGRAGWRGGGRCCCAAVCCAEEQAEPVCSGVAAPQPQPPNAPGHRQGQGGGDGGAPARAQPARSGAAAGRHRDAAQVGAGRATGPGWAACCGLQPGTAGATSGPRLAVPCRARAELEERVAAMQKEVLAATERMDRFKLAMSFNQVGARARRGDALWRQIRAERRRGATQPAQPALGSSTQLRKPAQQACPCCSHAGGDGAVVHAGAAEGGGQPGDGEVHAPGRGARQGAHHAGERQGPDTGRAGARGRRLCYTASEGEAAGAARRCRHCLRLQSVPAARCCLVSLAAVGAHVAGRAAAEAGSGGRDHGHTGGWAGWVVLRWWRSGSESATRPSDAVHHCPPVSATALPPQMTCCCYVRVPPSHQPSLLPCLQKCRPRRRS